MATTIRVLILAVLLMLVGFAFSHAFIVLGTLETTPATPVPNEAFHLRITMVDVTQTPVLQAVVFSEFTLPGRSTIIDLLEPQEEEGVYEATIVLPAAGEYQLLLRDKTYRQEDAIAELSLFVGVNENPASIAFIFPPTRTTDNILMWLIWLIGVPVLAGIFVTIMVLNSKKPLPKEAEAVTK